MELLSLSFFGGFRAERNGRPITAFESNKVRALLAYLAVEADRPHQRSALAGLLWPDHTEEAARTNLRHVLRQLRQSLAEGEADIPLLVTTQQTIQLSQGGYTLDVARSSELLGACERCSHRSLEACPACIGRYGQAAALYRGPLLADLDIPDSEIFEEWIAVQREKHHRQALEICFALASYHEGRGDAEQARQYALRQIELEPWREEAHRQVMRALARSGQRAAALAQYRQCRAILERELGVEPDPETVALAEQIRARHSPALAAPGAPVPAARPTPEAPRTAQPHDWGEAPATSSFFGRHTELATLAQWMTEDRCRVVAVLSIGGMGKTTLVAKAARMLAEHFDAIFWRSLLNAPPLPQVLRACLQRLTGQLAAELPDTLGDQLAQLGDCLRRQRCLLVLDNVETILDPQRVGRYRPGYEEYGQLIEYFAQTDHRSCLVLTSRERPYGMARLAEDTAWVRTLNLKGLDRHAAQALLKTRGLDDSAGRTATLVAHYSGNPLALKLVARTIQELFDSDIAAFLSDEIPIFDDIRTVLDQQFARLSELEPEILIWLAIEREAVSLQQLAEDFVQAPGRRELLEALRALQRRSLLEKTDAGFTLQNVVMEYVTELVVERGWREIERGAPDLLSRHALLKAQAVEYVRQSQIRLLLAPIAARLVKALGVAALTARMQQLLTQLRADAPRAPGYAAGNIMNLLVHLGVDIGGYDFSHLSVWQAYLRGAYVPGLNLTGADLAGAAFTHIFGQIQGIEFGPDGRLLAVGLKEGAACVWDARAGALLHVAPAQDLANNFVNYHAKSGLAAQGGRDHRIVIVAMADGSVRHTLDGHRNPIWRLVFSGDGRCAASGDALGQVRVWDVAAGRLRHGPFEHTHPVATLSFSPDTGMLVSGAVDGTVCLWDLADGTLLRTWQAHEEEVTGAQFVLGGGALATASHDRTVRIWDIASGALAHELRRHGGPIRLLAADHAGHMLASGGFDPFIVVWDAATGRALHTLGDHGTLSLQLAFSPDGARVAALDLNDTIHEWDALTGRRLDMYRTHHGATHTLAFRPDGRRLASGGVDAAVYIWDVDDIGAPRVVARFHGHPQRIESVVFGPRGDTLASGDRSGGILLWDLQRGEHRPLDARRRGVVALAFSPDGHTLASAGADGTVLLSDLRPGHLARVLRGHENEITNCAFSPDGRWVVSASMDRTVCVWDAETGARRHTLRRHTNVVRGLAFCPDGRRVVSCGYDRLVCLWDLESGLLLASWECQHTAFNGIAVHPDGARLAAGGYDCVVRLLDLETGRVLNELHGHSRDVEAVAFRPDGRILASASGDETIRLWDVNPGAAGACAALLRTPGPYAGMNITGVTGITAEQRMALTALGAVDERR